MAESTPPPGPPSTAATVLLVEDEPDARRVLREMLKVLGYDVLEAGDGTAALRLLREHPGRIDLLLTDMVLPEMIGPGLIGSSAVARPGMKVLCISGYASSEFADLDPSIPFLPKPFTLAALREKLAEVLAAS